MQIISHRGFWKSQLEKNTLISTKRSIDAGYGVEIDIRDAKNELIVSHDVPAHDSIKFSKHLELDAAKTAIWAVNIKADGIGNMLAEELGKKSIVNYFAFDMSIPEMYVYSLKKIKFFTSVSDLCKTPVLLDEASGVWLDSFNGLWYDKNLITKYLLLGKKVCVVSEELHGRSYERQWHLLKEICDHTLSANIMICTDFPDSAKEYFDD